MISITRPSRILSRQKLRLAASFDRLLQEQDFFASSFRDVKKRTFSSCKFQRNDLPPSSSSFELNQIHTHRVSLVNNNLFASTSPHAFKIHFITTRKIHSTSKQSQENKQETKLKAGQDIFIDSPNNKKDPVVLKTNPRALFPWRHSPFILNRINPDSVEFMTQGAYPGPHLPFMNQFFRSLAWINAAGFLGAKVLSYFSWQRELEEGFLYAFEVAVQEMLDDVYKNSKTVSGDGNEEEVIENHKNEGIEEDLGKMYKEGQDEATETTTETEADADATSNKESATEDFPISFQHSITPTDDYHLKQASQEDASHHMIESTLISLYRSAHTFGKHKLEINLQSRPKAARLESLFVFPFLTRKEVGNHLHLKHCYRNIVKAIQTKTMEAGRELNLYEIGNVVAEELDQLSAKQMKRNASGNMQITIVAQVSIQCDEIFKVVDTEIGDVVQGDKDGNVNDVTHLVRFEMVVDLTKDGDIQLGTWQITDWDDLLDGNMFFSDYHTV